MSPRPPLRAPSPRTALRRVNVRLPQATASEDAIFIFMRRMRGPLVLVLIIFAVDVFGLTLMPGVDGNGNPHHLTVFDALYVMSYTATTIGFGEIPYAFSLPQRMWVLFSIYTSVVGWAYAVGVMLSLIQDRSFQAAVRMQRFARRIRMLREPFLIIAGYGEMGQRVADILDSQGRRLVVIDRDDQVLDQLAGGRLSIDVPRIDGDMRDPTILNLAGLSHPYCEGVLALTHNDSVNLAVVMAVQLIRPEVPVIARVDKRRISRAMHDFRAEGIINPFDRYGAYLTLLLQRPATHRLVTWLLAPYGTPLGTIARPRPNGHWVVASDDQFGDEMEADLTGAGLTVTRVRSEEDLPPMTGVEGLVAGTTDDSDNLAMAAHARLENPDLFLSLRAHTGMSQPLLKAFAPDSIFIPAQLTAEEALARVITPDFWTFFEWAFNQSDAWSRDLIARITARSGEGSPASRRFVLDKEHAPGVESWLRRHSLTLGDLLRDPQDRDQQLTAVPLIVTRHGADDFLPADDLELHLGDELVVAGTYQALDVLERETLFHAAAVEYVATGEVVPSTWLFRKLSPRVQDV